jgi:hypothetical protein
MTTPRSSPLADETVCDLLNPVTWQVAPQRHQPPLCGIDPSRSVCLMGCHYDALRKISA